MFTHDDLAMGLRYLKKTQGIQYTCETNKEEQTQTWNVTGGSTPTASEMEEIIEEAKTEEQWSNVRIKRTRLLAESDYTQLGDFSGDSAAWLEYRQALRDVTNQDDPFNIVYPTKPEVGT